MNKTSVLQQRFTMLMSVMRFNFVRYLDGAPRTHCAFEKVSNVKQKNCGQKYDVSTVATDIPTSHF